MKNHLIFLILFITFSIGCQEKGKEFSNNPRNCNCPMENLPDEQLISDSIYQKNGETDLFDWSLDGKLSGSFKKIIDAEVKGNIQSNERPYRISTKKIIEKISNNHPNLISKAYSFKVGKIFYCTYYTILCQDTTISNQELNILSQEKLEEFRKDFLTHPTFLQNDENKIEKDKTTKNDRLRVNDNINLHGDVKSYNQKGGITAQQVTINTVQEEQPQIAIKYTTKPYLRYSKLPSGLEISYEICFNNSGKHPAVNIKYQNIVQKLITPKYTLIINQNNPNKPPSKLVSGDKFCQIFSISNTKMTSDQTSQLIQQLDLNNASILMEINYLYEDGFTGKSYSAFERNNIKTDRVEIF